MVDGARDMILSVSQDQAQLVPRMTSLGELDAGSDFGEQLMSLVGHSRPGPAGRRSSHVRYAPKATVGHQNAIGRDGPFASFRTAEKQGPFRRRTTMKYVTDLQIGR